MRKRNASRTQVPRRGIGAFAAALGGLLLLSSLYLWLIGAGRHRLPGEAPVGGAFTLTREDGSVVTDRDFRGSYLLIYFGYTSCKDVCPATLGNIAAALDRLGGAASDVRAVFITVDPERDTAPVVRRYLSAFSPLLVGLTGTAADVRHVAGAYRVTVSVRAAGGGADRYEVDHSAVIFLMGPDGAFRTAISADASPAAIAATVMRTMR